MVQCFKKTIQLIPNIIFLYQKTTLSKRSKNLFLP